MATFSDLAQKITGTNSAGMGKAINDMAQSAIDRRKPHERRWYDNNFFDDGYHFRTVSRKTGKVIDHTQRNSQYVERAIPRASRQIRGVSNLIFAAEPYPVVYPKRISAEEFRDQMGEIDQKKYVQAMEASKQVARKQGSWLSTEWEEQELNTKLIDLILLAAKNSVAWLQVYSDSDKQKIITSVFDAFDVLCYGDVRDEAELPFIIKSSPMDIDKILSDSRFNESMLKKLSPDNKYATSDVKDAYMTMRYGSKVSEDKNKGTLIVYEGFVKEILNEKNWKMAVKLGSDTGAMEGKSKGDTIMRHPFVAGGVTLLDEYINYEKYPLIPFRFEPGPLYQVPFIERFIPQNKSLDVIVTRLEKWVNAMVVGVYQKQKGENFEVSNFPGGQMIEYAGRPLEQMQMSTVGNTPFQVIELLNKFLEEQGSTTAALGQIPSGVKSGVAIESVKATEYANLKIANLMLKKTIKGIAECMLERADKDYLKPQEVATMEDGEPNYFDVIGKRGYDLSQELGVKLPQDIIVLDQKTKVRIEIEPGLGLTMEGKKQAMDTIISKMMEFATVAPGMIPPEAFKQVIKKFLENFGYGSTQELMEAFEQGMTQGDMTEEQIMKMKIAIIEALRDAGAVGPEMEERLVNSTKVGVLETLQESGLIDKMQQGEEPVQQERNKVSISYKDLPPDGKAQAAAQAGIRLNPQEIAADEAEQQMQERVMKTKEMQLKEKTVNSQVKKSQVKPKK